MDAAWIRTRQAEHKVKKLQTGQGPGFRQAEKHRIVLLCLEASGTITHTHCTSIFTQTPRLIFVEVAPVQLALRARPCHGPLVVYDVVKTHRPISYDPYHSCIGWLCPHAVTSLLSHEPLRSLGLTITHWHLLCDT